MTTLTHFDASIMNNKSKECISLEINGFEVVILEVHKDYHKKLGVSSKRGLATSRYIVAIKLSFEDVLTNESHNEYFIGGLYASKKYHTKTGLTDFSVCCHTKKEAMQAVERLLADLDTIKAQKALINRNKNFAINANKKIESIVSRNEVRYGINIFQQTKELVCL